MNIFETLYPRFYFDKSKPVRLFEAFSGIGCQAMALKRITDNYELVGFSEIDVHAIKSYIAIHGEVKNYGDITQMASIPPCDIFTWSFPCTDLSKAGRQKGLTNTRSGLVYEVLRLLHSSPEKPKVLIMENVIDLVQSKFVSAFNEIQHELETLGYMSYGAILNAKDFEIPQNRDRVFMVSILGDNENPRYSYAFPTPKLLNLCLRDLLEPEVDKRYYLSKKQIDKIQQWNSYQNPLDGIENEKLIAPTLTARGAGEYHSGMVLISEPKDISNTIRVSGRGSLDRHTWDLVVVPKLVQVAQLDGYESRGRVYSVDGLAPTINTMGGGQREPKIAWGTDLSNYRIRRVTPLECWRLMGIDDEDYWKAKDVGVSDTQLYKQAGNGIVVNVFEAILRRLIK